MFLYYIVMTKYFLVFLAMGAAPPLRTVAQRYGIPLIPVIPICSLGLMRMKIFQMFLSCRSHYMQEAFISRHAVVLTVKKYFHTALWKIELPG